jgi:hypothetical protein
LADPTALTADDLAMELADPAAEAELEHQVATIVGAAARGPPPRSWSRSSSPPAATAGAAVVLILRYAHDAELRARIRRQLNRGESRHALARRLFFANQGTFRVGDRDEIMNKVTALSLLSNAVLVWNSVRFGEVIAGLEATTGDTVAIADLARVSPLVSAHVIPSGTIDSPRFRGPWSNISLVGAWDPW